MWNESGRSTWGPLKGDEVRAREDAERREWLDRAVRAQGIRGNGERYCDDCHQQLGRRCLGDRCKKCNNKHAERARRQKAARARLASKGIHL